MPDYAGAGFFNLAVSLARACGADVPERYASLAESHDWASRHAIVCFLVDGLGDDFLFAHRDIAPRLWADRLRALTSVFPSTTATAITTLLTARSAATHGLLGWHVDDTVSGRIVAPLPMRYRGGEPVREATTIERILRTPSMFASATRATHIVTLPHLTAGAYSLHHADGARSHAYAGLGQLAEVLAQVSQAEMQPHFIYCYTPALDATAHDFGIASPQARCVLAEVEAAYVAMRAALPEALLVVSADHGFIDAPAERCIELTAWPALYGMLAAPLTGEPRMAYCRVKPAYAAQFGEAVEAELGHALMAVPSADLFDAGLFGPDDSPLARGRAGDWTLIARGDWTVRDTLPGERKHAMIGMHGGPSRQEMYVPLIVGR
ncbi:MAG: alkaline phosphatase family protein [Rhodocyclaceae bacterium]